MHDIHTISKVTHYKVCKVSLNIEEIKIKLAAAMQLIKECHNAINEGQVAESGSHPKGKVFDLVDTSVMKENRRKHLNKKAI